MLLFEPGTNPMRARQMVMERLTQVYTLPNVGKPPMSAQSGFIGGPRDDDRAVV